MTAAALQNILPALPLAESRCRSTSVQRHLLHMNVEYGMEHKFAEEQFEKALVSWLFDADLV